MHSFLQDSVFSSLFQVTMAGLILQQKMEMEKYYLVIMENQVDRE